MGEPTTIQEAEQLRVWALAPAAPAPAATTDQLARHLEFMHAALPSRGNDVDTAKKRFAVYASILAGRTNEALAFMARTACATLEWFPSPKQCLDILATYRPPESPQAAALIAADGFMQRTFDAWLCDLRAGGAIGDVPDRWKRIAVEQGDVRRLADGSFVSRLLYHGPPTPPYRPPSREPVAPAAPPAPPSRPVIITAGEPGASEGLVA